MDLELRNYRTEQTVALHGRIRWHAYRHAAWGLRVDIREAGGGSIAELRQPFWTFRKTASVHRADGSAWRFDAERSGYGQFRFASGSGEPWRLYHHVGRRLSVFAGDRQVAAARKGLLEVALEKAWSVTADDDVDATTLALALIAFGAVATPQTGTGFVTLDAGRIGLEARPFDEAWEPRRVHDG